MLRKILFASLVLIVVAALGWSVGGRFLNPWPDDLLLASGRMEGDEAVIAPKVAGQVVKILKDKGEAVAPGELLALISSEQIAARLKAAQEQEESAAKRLAQAEIDLDYTRGQVQASIDAAQAQAGAAAAQVEEARAEAVRHEKDYRRYQALFTRRVVSRQMLDQALANHQAAAANLAARGKRLQEARAQLAQARLLTKTVEAKEAVRQAAFAELQAARAMVQEAAANLTDTRITSPIRGVVLTREAEPGLVVTPGTPLFTIVDLDRLYLKVFIHQTKIGLLRLGQEARLYVDAYPDRHFEAAVSRVSQRAEFTPKYVETREERVKLVFAVELRAVNPEGYLKPGMPADGVIRLKEGVPWRRPR
ncbi:MAG: HlyD family efflux transporter periplasmic adaptor subunit [Deltaproteobacteria bacterium]|nr:HlyD family efflux transporter periplasmic adaptor subunit [Deltaproteobacteria bacterium]